MSSGYRFVWAAVGFSALGFACASGQAAAGDEDSSGEVQAGAAGTSAGGTSAGAAGKVTGGSSGQTSQGGTTQAGQGGASQGKAGTSGTSGNTSAGTSSGGTSSGGTSSGGTSSGGKASGGTSAAGQAGTSSAGTSSAGTSSAGSAGMPEPFGGGGSSAGSGGSGTGGMASGTCGQLCKVGPAKDASCSPCVADICNSEPSCCNGEWDALCAGLAAAQCPSAGCIPPAEACVASQGFANSASGKCKACVQTACATPYDYISGSISCSFMADDCNAVCSSDACFCSCMVTSTPTSSCEYAFSDLYGCIANNCEADCN